MHCHSHAVANSVREVSAAVAFRIERQHAGTVGVTTPARAEAMLLFEAQQALGVALAHAFGVVRRRADRDEHARPIVGESDVAGGVAAAWQPHDGLRPSARPQIAAAVGETDDRGGHRDIEPTRVGSRRIEGEPERLAETARECVALARLVGSIGCTQHPGASGVGFGHEDVAVGRDA
jgi:hypothetical protein